MKNAFLLLFLIFGVCTSVFAHGLYLQSGQEGAFIWVRAVYEGDIPLPFALVSIYAPDEAEYQNGRCDRNGHFAFQADRKGNWRITVDDELGHMETIEILAGNEGTSPMDSSTPSPASSWLKWLLGVSLILLLTAALYIWKKRL